MTPILILNYSTMKKLLGTAVKKTTGAAKLVADVAKKGRLKET